MVSGQTALVKPIVSYNRIGRIRIYAFGAAGIALWAVPMFLLIDTGSLLWLAVGTFVAGCFLSIMYGPQASLIAESFPTSLRYGGAGLGYQLASVVAGGPAALVSTFLIHQFGSGYAVSAYILVSALITLAACAAIKDYSRSDIDDDATYARARTARM